MFSLSLTTICKDVILHINHYGMNVFTLSLPTICKDESSIYKPLWHECFQLV